jgi:hypothetical protein
MKMKKIFRNLATFLLLLTFLLTYFLDLTGLELHQYLGIAAALIAVIHLVTHWDWVRSSTIRFFGKLSAKPRLYYAMDFSLFLSIAGITVTGVLISTWLEIDYGIYPAIRSAHILLSIFALVILIVKLAFHWKFFVANIKSLKRVRKPVMAIETNNARQERPKSNLTRREAMATIGSISLIGALGLIRAVSAASFKPSAALPDPQVNSKLALNQAIPTLDQTEPEVEAVASQGQRRKRGKSEGLENPESPQASTQDPLPQTAASAPPSENIAPEDCVIRCPEGCAYPGTCRRYIDENQNQLCDLGECL